MSKLVTLSNGARVFVDPMDGFETSAVGVWVQAGAVDESTDEHGVAHLLEHMAFKGTRSRTARGIVEEIEAAGGHLNASTSHQRTGYYARVLQGDETLALDILADILHDPLFDRDELEKEKEVVIQEIGEAADQPDDVVFDNLSALAWASHPLGLPVLGDAGSIRKHDAQRLRAFMDRLYRPERMVIAAAGAVRADEFIKCAEVLFGKDSAAGPRPSNRRTAAFAGGVRHDARSLEQTHLAAAFTGTGARDKRYFAMRVLAEMLGGGMSSRLFQTIREERGLAYSVYAFADCFDENGLLGFYAGASEENLAETAGLIREALAAVAAGASTEELDRARALLKSSLFVSLENPALRIEMAAGQLFTHGALMSADEIRARLDAVTVGDVSSLAMTALESAPALSLVGPAGSDSVWQALKSA